jgi:hypothetical protein
MKLYFHMSEAQADRFPDWNDRHLEIETEGDVQLTYGSLRDESGTIIATHTEDGYWLTANDDRLYSDIGVSA